MDDNLNKTALKAVLVVLREGKIAVSAAPYSALLSAALCAKYHKYSHSRASPPSKLLNSAALYPLLPPLLIKKVELTGAADPSQGYRVAGIINELWPDKS